MPFLVFAAPFIIMRNTIRGAAIEGRRFGFAVLATLLAGFWSLMSGTVVVMAFRRSASWSPELSARQSRPSMARSRPLDGERRMPIYELDGQAPEFPADGRYWVADTAVLIGRVRLKSDASVWFGAVLRGDNEWIELGERSQIQDNATLHTDPGFPLVIGANCVIGHNVMLHGCTIGDNSLIGMGAILLNGAKIGNNSLVGAGALVTEGKSFPDNSLIVGAPARVIRTLDDKAVEMIRGRRRHLRAALASTTRKGLKRIDCHPLKKVRPALGGEPAAREPGLGTGRGGDVTGAA